MKRLPDIPVLQIVPTDALHPHERHDDQRAKPLVADLQASGMLKNPPIVMPLGGERIRYVVLDGANRVLAMKLLGLPHALVQVAHPNGDSVDVKTWNHIVMCQQPEALFERLNRARDLVLQAAEESQVGFALDQGEALAALAAFPDRLYKIVGQGGESLAEHLQILNHLADCYYEKCRFERTGASTLRELEGYYPDMACLVIFPNFEVRDVVTAAAEGIYFPSGITRFLVSPRALRMNYPLDRLSASKSIEEKQAELQSWISERMQKRQVRFYAESTFLFDE